MLGTGTLLDPYVIQDVNDLQNVQLDPLAYYELGNDIDASATAGWDGGRGFKPIQQAHQVRRPDADFAQAGVWTIFPADGIYHDKVSEVTQDVDTTYVKYTTGVAGTLLFTFPAFNIPVGAVGISIFIRICVRGDGTAGSTKYNPYCVVNGTTYQPAGTATDGGGMGANYHMMSVSIGTNPDTGAPWTVDDINGLGINPLQALGFRITQKDAWVTQVYFYVFFELPNTFTFDGKGHKITDLSINRPDYAGESNWSGEGLYGEVGLFGNLNGMSVKNLTLENISIIGCFSTGAVAGMTIACGNSFENITVSGSVESTAGGGCGGLIGFCGVYGSTTDRVTFTDCHADVTIIGLDYNGGIIGWAYYCDLVRCDSAGIITSGEEQAGGMTGDFIDGTMFRCHSSMDINMTGGTVAHRSYAGGLCGSPWLIAAVAGVISQCWATGNITNGGKYIGGLYGYGEYYTINCYARGDVVGSSQVGGLIGEYDTDEIVNCYSTGQVTGGADTGGLVGHDLGAIGATASFWDTVTSGTAVSALGIGHITSWMKTKSNFTTAGWDFTTPIWYIVSTVNDGYPNLTGGVVIPIVVTLPATGVL